MLVTLHVPRISILTYAHKVTVTAGLYWTVFECGIGLIAACLPCIYVLFKRFSESYLGLSSSQSKKISFPSWRTIHPRSQRPNPTNISSSASDLDLVPLDVSVATIDTKVSERRGDSKHDDDQSDGILVTKTVRRTEDMI